MYECMYESMHLAKAMQREVIMATNGHCAAILSLLFKINIFASAYVCMYVCMYVCVYVCVYRSLDIPLFPDDLEAHLLLVYLRAHLAEEFLGMLTFRQ